MKKPLYIIIMVMLSLLGVAAFFCFGTLIFDNMPNHRGPSTAAMIGLRGKTLDTFVEARLIIGIGSVVLWFFLYIAASRISMSKLAKAAERGDLKLVKELLASGQKTEAGDGESKTALHYAIFRGHAEVVQVLLDAGANPNSQSEPSLLSTGVTPLDTAIERGHVEIVRLLVKRGANVNADSPNPLAEVIYNENPRKKIIYREDPAMSGKRLEIVKALLENGADPNQRLAWRYDSCAANSPIRCFENGTPLMIAARHGCVEIVKILLEHGADVSAKDSKGLTAANFAEEHPEVVKILADKMAT